MQTFIDDVVENVNERLLHQSVVDFLHLEVEGSETFRDFGDERMRALLVLFVRRDKIVV